MAVKCLRQDYAQRSIKMIEVFARAKKKVGKEGGEQVADARPSLNEWKLCGTAVTIVYFPLKKRSQSRQRAQCAARPRAIQEKDYSLLVRRNQIKPS